MPPRIVVVGSTNTDMVIRVTRFPQSGETILGNDFTTHLGGKGANQAVAAARAGADVTFISRIGRDPWGDQAMASFRQEGINVDAITRDRAAPTGVAMILVNELGENTIAVASGANAQLSAMDIHAVRDTIAEADIVLTQWETPLETVQAVLRLAKHAGVTTILNPAPAQRVSPEAFALVDFLTPNEHESHQLTEIAPSTESAALAASETIRRWGVGAVIMTLGARGAWVHSESLQERIPTPPVKVVDTTAAGDVFNGVLAVAIAEGEPLRSAVQFANGAAALAVSRLGAQAAIPWRHEIDALVAQDPR